jgi:hypothetical protein
MQLEVGHRLGAPEVQLRILRGREHRERQWRQARRVDAGEPRVDAELAQLGKRDVAERVTSDFRVDGRAPAEAGGCDRDVRRGAADRLDEALGIVPVGAELAAVQVDADPSNRQQLEIRVSSVIRVPQLVDRSDAASGLERSNQRQRL